MSLPCASEKSGKSAPLSGADRASPVCHARILMSYPFFSLAKTPRHDEMAYGSEAGWLQITKNGPQGLATIWDADILIWATSKIVQQVNGGRPVSRRIEARAHEILIFLGRGRSKRAYIRLRNSLDRLRATRVETSYGADKGARNESFSWVEDWREKKDAADRVAGLEILFSEWFYKVVREPRSCLSIDRRYFRLTGGLERWLYLLARKHGGRQESGWAFDLDHLHRKSGSTTSRDLFVRDLRGVVKSGRLIDYRLSLSPGEAGNEQLSFRLEGCGQVRKPFVPSGHRTIVPSGQKRSCYRVDKSLINCWEKSDPGSRKLYSKIDSKRGWGGWSDKTSPETLPKLRPDQAFDMRASAAAPLARKSPSCAPKQAKKADFTEIARADQQRPVRDREHAHVPRDHRQFLNELLSRRKIPMPGEPS